MMVSGIIIIIYSNYKLVFTGGSGTTVRHNTQLTHMTKNNTHARNTTPNHNDNTITTNIKLSILYTKQ
jgi:hypothetical protein